jgi:hypothetical protein
MNFFVQYSVKSTEISKVVVDICSRVFDYYVAIVQ